MSAFSPNEKVELASTDEVLDLFARDVANLDEIKTDLDFNSKVFEPNYVSKPAASPLEHTRGSYTGTFDVR
ncbi:TPA: hypothetical protein ACH3X1_013410 [Trebouxia sp. C0004]